MKAMQVVSKQQIGTTVMKSILFNVFPLCTTQIHLVCILALGFGNQPRFESIHGWQGLHTCFSGRLKSSNSCATSEICLIWLHSFVVHQTQIKPMLEFLLLTVNSFSFLTIIYALVTWCNSPHNSYNSSRNKLWFMLPFWFGYIT